MSLIKSNNRRKLFPLWRTNSFQDLLDSESFFNTDFFEEDSLMPAVNVKENDKNFEVEFAAPGFSKENFEITVDEDILNVCGKKEETLEEKEKEYTLKEFSYNTFKRSLKLPKSINTDKNVKAVYKDGILKLTLQKEQKAIAKNKKTIPVM
ncbi:MAG TPA: Hsp20/alpha crystallin family protein [Flavobacteriaceae bacterium]|nr:Hsp20/alpha crystallin family protein [Flavobacteriaceae bacterium]